MTIPITGTVKQINPCILGDDDDYIRPIEIDLGNVSWKLVRLDLKNELMEIEVIPAEILTLATGKVDGEGEPILDVRPATSDEKAQFIEYARDHSLERMSKEDLYSISSSPRLINPFARAI